MSNVHEHESRNGAVLVGEAIGHWMAGGNKVGSR
jgi:hypothetical protein